MKRDLQWHLVSKWEKKKKTQASLCPCGIYTLWKIVLSRYRVSPTWLVKQEVKGGRVRFVSTHKTFIVILSNDDSFWMIKSLNTLSWSSERLKPQKDIKKKKSKEFCGCFFFSKNKMWPQMAMQCWCDGQNKEWKKGVLRSFSPWSVSLLHQRHTDLR